jgi:hypothetical protein
MKDGFCEVCPNKCSWKAHINDYQIVTRVYVEVEKTNEDLEKQYNIHSDTKNKHEALLLEQFNEYSASIVQTRNYCEELKKTNEELSKI